MLSRPVFLILCPTLLSFSAFADSKVYKIKGMGCSGCVKNIEAKVCKSPELTSCQVQLGEMTLTSKNPLDDAKISALVKDAGKQYSVESVTPHTSK